MVSRFSPGFLSCEPPLLGARASRPHFRRDTGASCTSDAGETPAPPGGGGSGGAQHEVDMDFIVGKYDSAIFSAVEHSCPEKRLDVGVNGFHTGVFACEALSP